MGAPVRVQESQLRCDLMRAGIPWSTPGAIFRAARQLNSGEAYLAAFWYLHEYIKTIPHMYAISTVDMKHHMLRRYLQHAHEAR